MSFVQWQKSNLLGGKIQIRFLVCKESKFLIRFKDMIYNFFLMLTKKGIKISESSTIEEFPGKN